MAREVRRVALSLEWPPTKPPGRYGFPAPRGRGWQMWNLTPTPEIPISPVFKTPEQLARWLADNKASAFANCTATYEQWWNMITGPGRAHSLSVKNGVAISGVEALMTDEAD